jgi:hypothetical protein
MRPRFIWSNIGAGGANREKGRAGRDFVAGMMRIVHSSFVASAEKAAETANPVSKTPATEIRPTCRHKAFPLREAVWRTGSTLYGLIIIENVRLKGHLQF